MGCKIYVLVIKTLIEYGLIYNKVINQLQNIKIISSKLRCFFARSNQYLTANACYE